jgi:hypothetical protein
MSPNKTGETFSLLRVSQMISKLTRSGFQEKETNGSNKVSQARTHPAGSFSLLTSVGCRKMKKIMKTHLVILILLALFDLDSKAESKDAAVTNHEAGIMFTIQTQHPEAIAKDAELAGVQILKLGGGMIPNRCIVIILNTQKNVSDLNMLLSKYCRILQVDDIEKVKAVDDVEKIMRSKITQPEPERDGLKPAR